MRVERNGERIVIHVEYGSPYDFPLPRTMRDLHFWIRQIAPKQWATKEDLVAIAEIAMHAAQERQ